MQMEGLKVLIFLPDSFRSRNLSMVRTESGPCSQSALSILVPEGPGTNQESVFGITCSRELAQVLVTAVVSSLMTLKV